MTTFIFFHGIAVNTANMLSGEIWRDTNDATKSRLYITTENAGEQHQLDVGYDTARDEWARVWKDITNPRSASEPCVCFDELPPSLGTLRAKCAHDIPVCGTCTIDNTTKTVASSERAEEVQKIERILDVAGTRNWSGRMQ